MACVMNYGVYLTYICGQASQGCEEEDIIKIQYRLYLAWGTGRGQALAERLDAYTPLHVRHARHHNTQVHLAGRSECSVSKGVGAVY